MRSVNNIFRLSGISWRRTLPFFISCLITKRLKAINKLAVGIFSIGITGLINLGGGVAYRAESTDLMLLHRQISDHFSAALIPQDRQGFRPHITVQNKVSVQQAKALFAKLGGDFSPFDAKAIGLDLWTYLGGPWQHVFTVAFGD